MRSTRLLFITIPSLLLFWACSDADSEGAMFDAPMSKEGDGDGVGASGSGGNAALPPELELEENFRSPVVSGPFLWSANPETNRVARIDARSLEISVMDGGHGPTFLAALPEGETSGGALVLNVLGGDASVFTSVENSDGAMGGGAGASLKETRLPVQDGASAWVVGKTGRFAVAWSRFEEDLRGALDGYQDMTVLSLSKDGVIGKKLSVGYRPSQVVMNDEETRIYVVSDPGISVIDLSAKEPEIVRELFLPDEGAGQSRDVSFTPDGSLAFVRLSRRAEVLIIRTEDDVRVTIPLPLEVTDLDLSGDGSLAVAVMRGSSQGSPAANASWGGNGGQGGQGGGPGDPAQIESRIALFPVPEIFEKPEEYESLVIDELIGSTVVAYDASIALFFTTAIANSHLTILKTGGPPSERKARVVDLQAPAQAAFISSDGRFAATVMTPPVGSASSGAFALVPVLEDLPVRIEGTATVPRFISLSGDRVVVTTWGSETSPAATFLGKFPDLSVDRSELPSEPLASGIVDEAGQAFVAQAHPEGRVTFIDLSTSAPTTVTGFELASKVVE